MSRTRTFLFAKEAEERLQELRNTDGFTGVVEDKMVQNMIENAKLNSRIGDKILIVVNPIYLHIPAWQREIRLGKAYAIGANYNSKKWDAPKVICNNGKLEVIDGQHRIFGAAKAGLKSVVIEFLDGCTKKEAIHLFLSQTTDKSKMLPRDTYRAALAAEIPEYVMLHDICGKHNVAVAGDETESNTVGKLTCISDGVRMIKADPNLLDRMLWLLGELEWNGYADSYNGKAYKSTVIRAMKRLYAYYAGRETEMENALISKCKGTEWFVDNLLGLSQDTTFDTLSDIVRYEMESPFRKNPKGKTDRPKKSAKHA